MSINYKGRKIKYIASDLDGTLLFDEGHKLDDETYELISKCIDENVLFSSNMCYLGQNIKKIKT